jgi:hypothetical protein
MTCATKEQKKNCAFSGDQHDHALGVNNKKKLKRDQKEIIVIGIIYL